MPTHVATGLCRCAGSGRHVCLALKPCIVVLRVRCCVLAVATLLPLPLILHMQFDDNCRPFYPVGFNVSRIGVCWYCEALAVARTVTTPSAELRVVSCSSINTNSPSLYHLHLCWLLAVVTTCRLLSSPPWQQVSVSMLLSVGVDASNACIKKPCCCLPRYTSLVSPEERWHYICTRGFVTAHTLCLTAMPVLAHTVFCLCFSQLAARTMLMLFSSRQPAWA